MVRLHCDPNENTHRRFSSTFSADRDLYWFAVNKSIPRDLCRRSTDMYKNKNLAIDVMHNFQVDFFHLFRLALPTVVRISWCHDDFQATTNSQIAQLMQRISSNRNYFILTAICITRIDSHHNFERNVDERGKEFLLQMPLRSNIYCD